MNKPQEKLPCLPLGDKVLLELVTTNKSPGGIDLPEKQIKWGIVRSIGMGVPEIMTRYHKGECKDCNSRGMDIGDKVYLPRGDTVGDKFEAGGKLFLLIPSQYIAGIMQE